MQCLRDTENSMGPITRREKSRTEDLFRPLQGTVACGGTGKHENYSRLTERSKRAPPPLTRAAYTYLCVGWPRSVVVETKCVLNNLRKQKRGCVPWKRAVSVAGRRLSRTENVRPRSYTVSSRPDGRLMRLPLPRTKLRTRRQKQEEPEEHRGWCTGCIGRVQIYAGATLMSARPHMFSFGSTGARESTCTSFDALRNESRFWPTVNQVLNFLGKSERERQRDRVKVEKLFQWNWERYPYYVFCSHIFGLSSESL